MHLMLSRHAGVSFSVRTHGPITQRRFLESLGIHTRVAALCASATHAQVIKLCFSVSVSLCLCLSLTLLMISMAGESNQVPSSEAS